MRTLVIALAVLAGLKLWTHQTLYHTATEQALLKAYGRQAKTACQRAKPARLQKTNLSAKQNRWQMGGAAKVVIGDRSLDVALWQVDHKHWKRRFKTPYIHLSSLSPKANGICVFNIMTGHARFLPA